MRKQRPDNARLRLAMNAVLFQIGWFACVLGAAAGVAWLGTLCVAAIAAWHLFSAAQPEAEARLLLAALAIGTFWEILIGTTGWIVYPGGASIAKMPPHWLLALWVLFATTLNSSLAWLKPRPWVAALFGATGAPLAFFSGARLGAAQLAQPGLALIALAIGWALLTPLLLLLAKRFCGRPLPDAQDYSGEVA